MLKKHQKKLLKTLTKILKTKPERKIWSNEEVLEGMNKELNQNIKLSTEQLGIFISRFQKSYMAFKHTSQKKIYYIFVKNEKENKRKD